MRGICTKHNVLLIIDEIVTGFCRAGKNFGIDHWNVQPGLMVMGKVMTGAYFPFSGAGVSEEVYSVFPGQILITGLTNSGILVGCVIAKAALDIYIGERIADHVTSVGTRAKERLEKEFLTLPNVGNIAGQGLNLSMEIVANKETKHRFVSEVNIIDKIVSKSWGNGIYVRGQRVYGADLIFFLPPLIMTEEEADKELDMLYPVIASLKQL